MKILIYIEPLIFHNDPFHFLDWLRQGLSYIQMLEKSGKDFDYRLLTTVTLSYAIEEPTGKEIFCQQTEIRRIFQSGNTPIMKKLHHQSWTEKEIQGLQNFYKEKLQGFEPDVILSFSPADFFKHIFPSVDVFYTGSGILPASKFAEMAYFDSDGQYDKSALVKNADQLFSSSLSDEDKNNMVDLKELLYQLTYIKSPFHSLEGEIRQSFDKILLLPLHISHSIYFGLTSPFHTNGELLMYVIENTPEDVAILVSFDDTAENLCDTFKPEFIAHLELEHPNVIVADITNRVFSANEYLVHHVDYVLNVSDVLAGQCLLWEKPLINIGHNQFSDFCIAPSMNAFWDNPGVSYKFDTQAVVAWMLKNYYVSLSYFQEHPEEFYDFLFDAKNNKGEGSLEKPYASLAEIKSMFEHLVQNGERYIPMYHEPYNQVTRPLYQGKLFDESGEVNLIINGGFSNPESLGVNPNELMMGWSQNFILPDFMTVSREPIDKQLALRPADELEWCLKVNAIKEVIHPAYIIQKVPQLKKFIGQSVTFSFWAKGTPNIQMAICFHLKIGEQHPNNVVTYRNYVFPTEDWHLYSFVYDFPEMFIDESELDFSSALEVIIEIPKALENTQIEFTGLIMTLGDKILPVRGDHFLADTNLEDIDSLLSEL